MTIHKLLERFLLKDLKLNENQYAAVLADEDGAKTAYRILVTAPAGSGKTRVLASRYLKLLVDGEHPENIVAITFTRKAAGEMKSRIVDYLFDFRKQIMKHKISSNVARTLCDTDELNKMVLAMRISTIDSFLSNIIRLFPAESGVDPNFSVVDEIEEEELIDRIIDEYIEENMQNDKNIIALLRFFNFKYAGTANERFCFSRTVQGIIKRWEIFSDTVNLVHSVSEETLRSWLMNFIGKDLHIDDHLRALQETSEILKSSLQKQSNIMPFIDYIINARIPDLKKNDSQFFKYRDLFYTTTKKLRKRPVEKLSNDAAKSTYEKMTQLYEKCMTDFLLLNDMHHGELSKPFISLLLTLIDRIKKKKRKLGILGIGDLKTTTHFLLNTHVERFNILYNMDARVNHYLIDEFQDTDPIQWDIFSKLTEDWFSGETAKQERNVIPTLFLVGDEKQSIYGFRNADVRIINNLKESRDYYTTPFLLEKNYRSAKEIITSVNSLFTGQMKRIKDRPTSVAYKMMKSHDTDGGGTVSIIETAHEGKQATRIPLTAHLVGNLLNSLHGHIPLWGDIALLFRHSLNFQYYEDALGEMHIPYISSGGKSFFDNTEVNEIIKMLSFLDNPHDDINFAALFLSPLFPFDLNDLLCLLQDNERTMHDTEQSLFDRLKSNTDERYATFRDMVTTWLYKRDREAIEQLIEDILLETNAYGILIDRKGGQKDVNVRKLILLIQNISGQATNFAFFFERLKRVMRVREKNADIDIETAAFEAEEKGAVHLMTVHKAKGLEFPVVILPEVDAAIIKTRVERIAIDREKPHILFLKKHAGMDSPLLKRYKQRLAAREEEELKRLLYVALTRAKKELYLFMNTYRSGEKNVWMNMVCNSGLPRKTKLELKIVQREETLLTPPKEHGLYQFSRSRTGRPLAKQTRPSDLHKSPLPFSIESEKAKLKGTVLHKLFELVSTEKLDHRSPHIVPAVRAIIQQFDSTFLSNDEFERSIIDDFRNALKNKEILSVVTNPEGLSEFPYTIERKTKGGTTEVVSGVIDRIVPHDTEVRIYDYKSDSPGSRSKGQFISWAKQEYQHQLEEYKSAARSIFDIDAVRTFLILTSISEIAEVS